ncbi:MAG: hypothetical protein H0T89_21995 [Deltaproteobacteria bacterium]|nr:hypothetical protein [Deltaproteobacteria bacterium]MDQ3297818.1 hypothetical protein [Myxococcota bacterium]
MRSYLYLLTAAALGCTDDGGSEGTAAVSGAAVYRDSATAHDGTPRQASSPPAQDAKLTLVVKGNATIPQVDPQCATDPVGRFEARYAGTMDIGSDGAYLTALAAGEIVTPSGCEIPELTVGVVTDIVLRAELTATTQNCQTYCEASARADAEASCGASASAAACRSSAESSAAASCMTTCTSQTRKIVAETSIGAGSLGQVDASALRAATFADVEARMVFDIIE